jgi:hypothetical protein
MWERISSGNSICSDRLKVPGGWLVRSYLAYSTAGSVIQTLVPDPEHTWELKKE